MITHNEPALCLDEPVVVLTSARAGSTLLRFLLDAHPELACPAETNLVKTAVQLAGIWRMLGAAGDGAPSAIRRTLDAMLTDYLNRRGKRRWCDKSLGTVECAEAFICLYPRVKFLCLYRHCMDVIASGIEACPWGVAGYGFDPYVSNSPGNNAAALAHYWADHTAAALAFEEGHPQQCLRLYYEDLVTDPEASAGKIFSFLGLDAVAGIAERCLAADHDRAGPADYKIWATGKISANSVGRGVTIPAGVIPAPLLGVVNDLLGKLDYPQVDERWAKLAGPLAVLPRQDQASTSDAFRHAAHSSATELDQVAELLTERISANLARDWSAVPATAPARPSHVAITAYSVNEQPHERSWQVNLDSGTIVHGGGPGSDATWLIKGDSQAWLSVLTGKSNLGVALRRGDLRYAKLTGDDDPHEDVRVHVMAAMLGLT